MLLLKERVVNPFLQHRQVATSGALTALIEHSVELLEKQKDKGTEKKEREIHMLLGSAIKYWEG